MNKPTLLILAAGIGSRYGGLKQLEPLGPSGETIIDYSIYDALKAGFDKVIFVIKKEIEQDFREVHMRKLEGKVDVDYVFQEMEMVPQGILWNRERTKPWGTGHAVLAAAGKIRGPFAVINSDDFYGRSAYEAVAGFYSEWRAYRENEYCMVGYRIGQTLSEHGTVSRGLCKAGAGSYLVEVTERTCIKRTGSRITFTDENREVTIPENTVVSMNFWGFTPSFFRYLESEFNDFIRQNADNPKAEFYIPSVVNEVIRSGRGIVKIIDCREQWFGMTYREDREQVVVLLNELIRQGIYPEKLW
jgi:UTP-glucose-1-phosphate uridylyltransferase